MGVSDLTSLHHDQDEFQYPLRLRDRALEGCVRVLGLSYPPFVVDRIFDIIVGRGGAALESLNTVAKDQVARWTSFSDCCFSYTRVSVAGFAL